MAVSAGMNVAVTVNMVSSNQRIQNVWTYNVFSAPALITAGQVGEAYWNHVKATYRALSQSAAGDAFLSVVVRELGNSSGELGEYAIPSADRVGTRTGVTAGQMLPTFNAVGARLVVTTRTTRPGQKRFPFLTEQDVIDNTVQAPFIALVNSLLGVANRPIVLGAPAATMALNPIVVSLAPDGTVLHTQATVGEVVNAYVTSQVSRKQGRGI